MFGFALLNSATFFFSCPMKVGEPHCMSQYFRTTLPFLSVPWPWVEPSPPPPPHAAAIRDRDARVAASVRRRRLVLAMETPWKGCYEGVRGRGPRKRCGALGGLEAQGKLGESSGEARANPGAAAGSGFLAVYHQDLRWATVGAAGFLRISRPIFGTCGAGDGCVSCRTRTPRRTRPPAARSG